MPEGTMILVLDTAMNGCTAGVWCAGEGILAAQSLDMPRGQSEVLVPMIERILKNAGIGYDRLDRIAVTCGPGAFTGMRIGLATARALGMTLEIPVTGVGTFEALLETCAEREGDLKAGLHYGVLIETKRDDYYFRLFDAEGQCCSEALSAGAEAILEVIGGAEAVLIGDAVARFVKEVGDVEGLSYKEILLPSAESIAVQAIKTGTDHDNAQPFYIRPPDVFMPKTSLPSMFK